MNWPLEVYLSYMRLGKGTSAQQRLITSRSESMRTSYPHNTPS